VPAVSVIDGLYSPAFFRHMMLFSLLLLPESWSNYQTQNQLLLSDLIDWQLEYLGGNPVAVEWLHSHLRADVQEYDQQNVEESGVCFMQ
jgi:hypothetical protein